MHQLNKHSVLVVLTGTAAVSMYMQLVRGVNITRDVHYTAFTHTGRVEELVTPDVPQLLFIDLLLFDIERTLEFVTKLKEKNPQLLVALYSPLKDVGEISDIKGSIIDFYIWDRDKDVPAKFRDITLHFIAGTLRKPESYPPISPDTRVTTTQANHVPVGQVYDKAGHVDIDTMA